MRKIGITTTVPIEVLIAAGYKVVDLNNIFITSENYEEYVELAEREGFPKNLCTWIKGIYGACISNDIKEIVGVIGGDCSNTIGLVDVLKTKGIKVYPFSYPHDHKLENIKQSIDEFMITFKVSKEEVESVRIKLNKVRSLAKKLDELTYKENKVSGFDNHIYQVSLSDLNSNDICKFEKKLSDKVYEMKEKESFQKKLRLGYIGVPPMTGNLFDFVEKFDATFVYNEVQREFAFPRFKKNKSIYEQYYDYTYPYSLDFRLAEIKKQIEVRELDGIIHYTQAFCHRAIEDIVIKQKLDVPILNIEGDKSNVLDARTKLRIEAFLDMLLDKKVMNK